MNIIKQFVHMLALMERAAPIFVVFCGAYLLWEGTKVSAMSNALQKDGIETIGEIVEPYTSLNQNGSKWCRLRVSFTVRRVLFTHDYTVSEICYRSCISRLRNGDAQVKIVYLPGQPQFASIDDELFDNSMNLYAASGLFFTLGLTWFLFRRRK